MKNLNPNWETNTEAELFSTSTLWRTCVIAAPTDQSTGATWGCKGLYISTSGASGTYTEVGRGEDNTKAIVFNCTTSGIAAKLCDDLTLGGYNDWFLPSIDELTLLFDAKILPGLNLGEFQYWSSYQANENEAFSSTLPVVPRV